jgi:predicted ATPase/transcriptional regulator with XRE-family HTH domain
MLRNFRMRAHLTQEALANRAGVGLTTLKALEGGQRLPHLLTVHQLADALELSEADRGALLERVQPAEVDRSSASGWGSTSRQAAPPEVSGAATNDQRSSQASATAPLGAMLRNFRTRARLTQEALADRSGVGLTTLKALEGGQRLQPHLLTVQQLADALELSEADRGALLERAQPADVERSSASGWGSTSRQVAAPDVSGAELPPLPDWLTSFVGREEEVQQVRAVLGPAAATVRLLTLLGPGGVGKTRLAVTAAAALAPAFRHGVWFVDLAPVSDTRLVPATIARAVGVREGGGRSARELLIEHLRPRQLLLVLDNLEHLLGAVSLLPELLRHCPHVALLTTSRRALRLQFERRFVVAPLPTPSDDLTALPDIANSPSVRLFVERAQAVQPEFQLDASNAGAVAAVCRRVDGIPLAIELAAARTGLLSPAALLQRLDRRLQVLTRGPADMPERQQTLRQTLTWSHGLLGPREQMLYRRLGIFVGGWTLEAAEAVGSDEAIPSDEVVDRLEVLVDSSLVGRTSYPEGRFGMLETVREYALEQLEQSGEGEVIRARHATYFLALAEQAEPQLHGPDARIWFDRLDRELDNLRAALAWAQSSGELELGLRLAVALPVFCEDRGHLREAREWLETLTSAVADSETAERLAPLEARALAATAWLAFLQGDYERAVPLAERSLARWRQIGQIGNSAVALNTLAWSARRDGDLARTEALLQESLALTRAEGDMHGSAAALSWLGTQRRAAGDLDAADALLQEAQRLYQATGTVAGIAYCLLHLGGVARLRLDAAGAQALFEQSLALYQSTGDRLDVAYAVTALAASALDAGDLARARSLCEEGAATFDDIGDTRGLADALRLMGRIAKLQGDHASAAEVYAQCLSLYRVITKLDLAFCLEGLALALVRVAADDGHPSQNQVAVRVLGAAAALREQQGSNRGINWSVSLPDETHADYALEVAATRATLGAAIFDAAWAAGRALSLEQAIAEGVAACAGTPG